MSEQRKQKKAIQRRAQAKARRKAQHAQAGRAPRSIARVLAEARSWPIAECLINPDWSREGLATIALARREPGGFLVLGIYLVDVFCLGLKDAMFMDRITPEAWRGSLRDKIYQAQSRPVPCPPELAHRIIYGAIDYAAGLGFRPHPDWEVTRPLLNPPETLPPGQTPPFGKDGKPFFIAGPKDDAAAIMRQLTKRVGEGNFGFLSPIETLEDLEKVEEVNAPEWYQDHAAYKRQRRAWAERDWPAWLGERLHFPFQAERVWDAATDSDEPTAKRFGVGHLVKVLGLSRRAHPQLGLMVLAREGWRWRRVALAELRVVPGRDPNHWPVEEYGEWIAGADAA